jgi:uncharacterized protein
MPVKVEPFAGGVKISVKVVPGSSRDRIVGELGDALKIAVSKPPQGGEANRAVISLLAERLGVPARQIQIIRGQSNPRKEVTIIGVTAQTLVERLGLG